MFFYYSEQISPYYSLLIMSTIKIKAFLLEYMVYYISKKKKIKVFDKEFGKIYKILHIFYFDDELFYIIKSIKLLHSIK